MGGQPGGAATRGERRHGGGRYQWWRPRRSRIRTDVRTSSMLEVNVAFGPNAGVAVPVAACGGQEDAVGPSGEPTAREFSEW